MRVFLAVFILANLSLLGSEGMVDKAKLAYEAYRMGEQANTASIRNDAFNKALALYVEIGEAHSSGKVYYNIANCYYQLQQYPWAMLYYYRAQKLLPRDSKIYANLAVTRTRLGITDLEEPSVFEKVFFLYVKLSVGERLKLFSALCLITTALASLYYWKAKRAFKLLTEALSLLTLILLLSLIVTRYFMPLYGVVITSTPLYRDAGYQYAPVTETPLFSGSKIKVLQVDPKGEWFKVSPPDGKEGYLPGEALRLVPET